MKYPTARTGRKSGGSAEVQPTRRRVLLSLAGAPLVAATATGVGQDGAQAAGAASIDQPSAHMRRYYELARY